MTIPNYSGLNDIIGLPFLALCFMCQEKYAYLRTVMAVKTHSPEILVLKQSVEKRFGHPIESRSDFSLLAIEIERVTHEHSYVIPFSNL